MGRYLNGRSIDDAHAVNGEGGLALLEFLARDPDVLRCLLVRVNSAAELGRLQCRHGFTRRRHLPVLVDDLVPFTSKEVLNVLFYLGHRGTGRRRVGSQHELREEEEHDERGSYPSGLVNVVTSSNVLRPRSVDRLVAMQHEL